MKVRKIPLKRDKRFYRPTPGKKVTVAVVLIIILILITIAALYFFIIPRTCLTVQTVYHERMGGGSTGGGININILFKNDGTTQIGAIEYSLTVINQTNDFMAKSKGNIAPLDRGEIGEITASFIGNHFETYFISLTVSFKSNGEGFSKDFSYMTEEDSMNLMFVDKIKD